MVRRTDTWQAITGVLVLLVFAVSASAQTSSIDEKLRDEIHARIDRALKYVSFKQAKNGSWNHYPGITALVVHAMMDSHRHYTEEDGPFLKRALQYLASMAKPDGAIYDSDLPNYNTSVAIMTLHASGNPTYKPLVERAQQFLIASQLDEDKGYDPSHKFYGAIGLGSASTEHQPDLDNLGFALRALKATGVSPEHPVWQKALRFIKRCQNRKASNDQPWAGDDGGFVFRPGFSYAGGTTSYASMTYMGLRSFLHAGVDRQNPMVQAAFDWLRQHYSVKKNPGLGQQALYHYYYFMASALRLYGEPVLVDAEGTPHDWRRELATELLQRQRFDGSWVNEVTLWWEGNPILATTFAVLTLEEITNE